MTFSLAVSSIAYVYWTPDGLPGLEERSALNQNCVLTPHEGEFERVFPEINGRRVERAVAAANLTNCTLVLKGAETVVARPGAAPAINSHASPYLAKAGSGDVLSGMIAGLMTQGMEPFEASCSAVWMHGEAGRRLGPGLVAADIEGQLADILAALLAHE